MADRSKLLEVIRHTPAAMRKLNPVRKHATGIHITKIPYDPVYNIASIDYRDAENRGYFKLDLLNIHVYSLVRDEDHLKSLMRDPDWTMLNHREVVERLIQVGNHYDDIRRMPEPITSITRMAMMLAVIRPEKRHLIGLPWNEVAKTVWEASDTGYTFKRSHSVAYGQLVAVHLNLLKEGLGCNDTSEEV